ncbi:MAG TPA: GNAT family N-acetyltransferase [Flavisolibacter sp.]
MIAITTAETEQDLKGILHLQKDNLVANISAAEKQGQGFVTVIHSYDQLFNLNAREKHIIAKDDDRVIGYLLAMTQRSHADIPVLIPMFDLFNELSQNGSRIADQNYIVVGQVCIDKSYRGQGILDRCYAAYKDCYSSKYSFAITEIATANTRSLAAHRRVGFEKLTTYAAPDGVEWEVVVWNWRKGT